MSPTPGDPGRLPPGSPRPPIRTRIERTSGVCGGDARIAGTRIPVWVLPQCRRLGQDESEILASYPSLCAADLVAAWSYVEVHHEEIDRLIRQNDEDEGPEVPEGA